ncbi:PAS domain-containing protein [Ferrovibrio sp.]|uniref:PAS domain-containing protein n=1 Tax=Ferrovibrio sp. TaxID=1917215 RepID=UPI000CB45F9F|nr:PAS domain-containing protein [Ferrovibrio sp.]PJI43798.1 MAG: hypothetical protein CTR53_01950 [Ferrovibrio sp.]
MNQPARKSVSSDAMTISQSTQRPLDTLLDDVTLPSHRLMVQHWLDLHAAAGHRIPRYRALDPLQFPAALPDIWIVEWRDDGRLYFHLVGQNLVDWYGSSPKGKAMEEVYPPNMVPLINALSHNILGKPAIYYQKAFSLTPHWSVAIPMERVAMPMTDEAGRLRWVAGITTFLDGNGRGSGPVASRVAEEFWYPVP